MPYATARKRGRERAFLAATIGPAHAANLCRTSAAISNERSRAVKLAIEQGNLVVSATSPENGTALEELEVRYQSSPMEIGFNSRYLLDITEQIDGEYAQFQMADAGSPTIVRDSADASALYVLMPMRV